MTPAREEGPAILPDSSERVYVPGPPGEDGSPGAVGGAVGSPGGGGSPGAVGTLIDDVADLLADARTYCDAELSYQKTRASFVTAGTRRAAAAGGAAAVLGLVALIALAVGLIIALTPLISAWGATAVVVGLLLLAAFLLVRKAAAAWREVMAAVHEEKGARDDQ